MEMSTEQEKGTEAVESGTDLTAYQKYQENIRRSEELQMEVLKEVRECQDPYRLLLKTARIVSLMTESDTFVNQIERMVYQVYGEALGEKIPVEMEMERVRDRLERIREAMKTADNLDIREGMELAVHSHEQKLERLKKKLESAEEIFPEEKA